MISGAGIGLNCISINETFCVTGSDDGYLRLWPLDFAHVYLEAGRFVFKKNVTNVFDLIENINWSVILVRLEE